MKMEDKFTKEEIKHIKDLGFPNFSKLMIYLNKLSKVANLKGKRKKKG